MTRLQMERNNNHPHLCHTQPPTFEQHHNLHPQSTHTTRTLMPTCTRADTRSRLGPGRPVGQEMLPYQNSGVLFSCVQRGFCAPSRSLHALPACKPSGHSVRSHSFYTLFIFKQATALRNPQAFAACTSSSDHESRGAESCRTTAGSGIRTR